MIRRATWVMLLLIGGCVILAASLGVGRETDSLMLMVTPRIVILEEEESLLGIPQ